MVLELLHFKMEVTVSEPCDVFKSSGENTNDIVIDNQPVSRVSHTKFLGVIIDEKLNWSEHVNNLKIKLAKGSGIIRKCRICFSIDTLLKQPLGMTSILVLLPH